MPAQSASLLSQVASLARLMDSWTAVAKRGSAPGIDRITTERYGKELHANLEQLSRSLRDGTYRPSPSMRFYPSSDPDRPLVIPTVADRIVQRAVADVLAPVLEPTFSKVAWAYRKGRGVTGALGQVQRWLDEGHRYFLETDIEWKATPNDTLVVRRTTAHPPWRDTEEPWLRGAERSLPGIEVRVAPRRVAPSDPPIHPVSLWRTLCQPKRGNHAMTGSNPWLQALDAAVATYDAARIEDLLAERPPRESDAPAQHMTIGYAAEMAGLLDRAITEYNMALVAEPGHSQAATRLVELRLDMGDLSRALELFSRLPDKPEALTVSLVRGLAQQGMTDRAAAVARAHLRKDHPVLLELSRAESPGPPEPGPPPRPRDPAAATEEDLITFCTRFAGREGVHARQWIRPGGGHGYSPVHEPLTPAVAKSHLMGAYTVGVYPVRVDNSVWFAALDIDVAKFALARSATSPGALERLLGMAHAHAKALADAARSLGVDALLEDSGWKGRHVWIFFREPVPAVAARRLLRAITGVAARPPAELQVELFPKQARVQPGGLGNLIKLPLGIHQVTGRRAMLLDRDGHALPDPFDALRAVTLLPKEELAGLLEQARALEVESLRDSGAQNEAKVIEFPAPQGQGADQAPMDAAEEHQWVEAEPPAYSIDEDMEAQWLLDRCPVLDEIRRRAMTTHHLTNDERIVVTYTMGHLSHGADAVNAILSEALNVSQASFLKRRHRGNPMSCPKIRSRVPSVVAAVRCDCRFEEGLGSYPTPLLHLHSLRQARGEGVDPARLSSMQLERMVNDLIELRAAIRRQERLARDLEARLLGVMQEQGLTEISTSMGVVSFPKERGGRLTIAIHGTGKVKAPDHLEVAEPTEAERHQ